MESHYKLFLCGGGKEGAPWVPMCMYLCVCVLVAQLCPALSNLVDCRSLSMGFSRQEYKEWVAIPFSRGSS